MMVRPCACASTSCSWVASSGRSAAPAGRRPAGAPRPCRAPWTASMTCSSAAAGKAPGCENTSTPSRKAMRVGIEVIFAAEASSRSASVSTLPKTISGASLRPPRTPGRTGGTAHTRPPRSRRGRCRCRRSSAQSRSGSASWWASSFLVVVARGGGGCRVVWRSGSLPVCRQRAGMPPGRSRTAPASPYIIYP